MNFERRFDMTRPCTNCPFRSDDTRIRFSNRQRAEEIEESGYRYGFPCHTTAVHIDDVEPDSPLAGYHFGKGSQHCIGFIMLMLKSGYDAWPGIANDEALADRIRQQVDWDAPVFNSIEAYLEANEGNRV